MKDTIDWIAKLTKDKMLTWHIVDGNVNEHLEDQRLRNAFMVVHSDPAVGSRFSGAYIGYRGNKKILCAAIIDGTGNWYYVDAKNENKRSVKDLLLIVKRTVLKNEKCKRCKGLEQNEIKIIELEKIIEEKDRTIAGLKRNIQGLRKHLSAFGVGKKHVWDFK